MRKSYKILIGLAIVVFIGATYRAPVVEAKIQAIKQLIIDLAEGDIPVAASSTVMADGTMVVGNSSGVGAAVTMSGDTTMSNAGVVTIGAGTVETAMLETNLQPSHVVKFSGKVLWLGTAATMNTAILGAYSSSDFITASISSAPSEAAYLAKADVFKNNSAIFTLSAANTSTDAEITYVIHRAAP